MEFKSISKNMAGLPWTCGMTGVVIFISEHAVFKMPLDKGICKKQLDTERQIYKRLGTHPYITKLLDVHQDGIILERLQYPLRQCLLNLRENQQQPTAQQVVQWALQTAKALQYIHSCGVKQVDISANNVLLDRDENAKLSDFAGSSLDDSEPTVAPDLYSTHPNISITRPSVYSELFAFGSLLYEVETTYQPYYNKNDQEIEELFTTEQYPDTHDLILGKVISKCWIRSYADASELIADVLRIQGLIGRVDLY